MSTEKQPKKRGPGKPPDEVPKVKITTLRLIEPLANLFKADADRQGRSYENWAAEIVRQYYAGKAGK